MVDILPTVEGDGGPKQVVPVMMFGSQGEPVGVGGASGVHRLLSSAATTNAFNIKSERGYVYHITGWNKKVSIIYLKLYNKATAPTVGTDIPFVTYEIAASARFDLSLPAGLYFSTGIGFAFTTGQGDADATALAAGDVTSLNIMYE